MRWKRDCRIGSATLAAALAVALATAAKAQDASGPTLFIGRCAGVSDEADCMRQALGLQESSSTTSNMQSSPVGGSAALPGTPSPIAPGSTAPGSTATVPTAPAPASQSLTLTPLVMPTPSSSSSIEAAPTPAGSSNNLGTFINSGGGAGSAGGAADRRTDLLKDPFD